MQDGHSSFVLCVTASIDLDIGFLDLDLDVVNRFVLVLVCIRQSVLQELCSLVILFGDTVETSNLVRQLRFGQLQVCDVVLSLLVAVFVLEVLCSVHVLFFGGYHQLGLQPFAPYSELLDLAHQLLALALQSKDFVL